MTRECIKKMMVLFCTVQLFVLSGEIERFPNKNKQNSHRNDALVSYVSCYGLRAQIQEIMYKVDLLQELEETDVELLLDLWIALAQFYKKAIEMTAIYLSGYSSPIFDKLLLDATKDLLHICQILTLYLPKFIKNKNISWQVKMKKILYATGVMAVTGLWMKEMYQLKKNGFGHCYFGRI